MTTIYTNVINPHVVIGTINDVNEEVKYRYRAGRHSPSTLRLSVDGVNGDTISLIVADPGQASTAGTVIETYTADTSKVFEPGGDCDVYLKNTVDGSGTVVARIYAGPRG